MSLFPHNFDIAQGPVIPVKPVKIPRRGVRHSRQTRQTRQNKNGGTQPYGKRPLVSVSFRVDGASRLLTYWRPSVVCHLSGLALKVGACKPLNDLTVATTSVLVPSACDKRLEDLSTGM